MGPNSRVAAQAIVIMGFLVSALSSVVSYEQTISVRGYDFTGFRQIVIPMLNPLTAIAALLAWWWLTKVNANDDYQRANLQRAYVAFALQYVFTTALILFLITPFRTFGGFWLTSVLWLQLVGAFISALGLFLLSRTLRARITADEEVTDASVLQ
jgi:ABC-type antimicrobial peptide transport system permease subunit